MGDVAAEDFLNFDPSQNSMDDSPGGSPGQQVDDMPGGMAVEDDWDAAGPTFSPQLEQPQRQQRKRRVATLDAETELNDRFIQDMLKNTSDIVMEGSRRRCPASREAGLSLARQQQWDLHSPSQQGLAPRLERLVRHCAQQCVDRVASTESSDAIAPDSSFVEAPRDQSIDDDWEGGGADSLEISAVNSMDSPVPGSNPNLSLEEDVDGDDEEGVTCGGLSKRAKAFAQHLRERTPKKETRVRLAEMTGTTRRSAARGLMCVLECASAGLLDVEQSSPFEEISFARTQTNLWKQIEVA